MLALIIQALQSYEYLAAIEDKAYEPTEEDIDESKSKIATLLTEKGNEDGTEEVVPKALLIDLDEYERPEDALTQEVEKQGVDTENAKELADTHAALPNVKNLYQHSQHQRRCSAGYHYKRGRPYLLADRTHSAEQEAGEEQQGAIEKEPAPTPSRKERRKRCLLILTG